jgi:septal ring factor EnvC (AmiA/AmiB activator)
MQRVVAVLCFLGALHGTNASVVAGSAHAAQMPTSTSPVTRIVELLKGLQEQCELDAKTDEKLYEKFVCWGREVIKQKEGTNVLATKEAAELTQYISDLDSGRIELTTERQDLVKEIADLSSSIELATATRAKEKADFENAEAEMTQAIEALSKAAEVLKTATEGHETGVLTEIKVQAGHRAEAAAKETAMLNRAVELGDRFLSKGDAVFLRRLLTGEVPTWDWNKLNRKATFKMSYKARSFKIQDVIAKLLQTFETNKADAIDKENKAVAAYNAEMESLNSQRDLSQEALAKLEKEKGAKALSRSEAQDRVDLLTEQIASDEKYIKQVKQELADKKAEWEERSRIRYGEIGAISKAIAILHNDGARDLFKKSLASQGYFFLQTGQHSTLQDASDVLRSLARKTSDQRILGLVTQVQLAPAFGSQADRFKPVIEKIDLLVTMIQEEEASDLAKKESCEKSRAENTREAIKLSRAIDEHTDTMSALTSDIERLEQQIEENKEAMAVLQKQMQEADEQRAAENKAYKADKADDAEAAATIQSAYDVLETFYKQENLMLVQRKGRAPVVVAAGKAPPPPPTTWDSPYGGRTGESTGILAILSMIKEDIERDISTADAAEAKSVAAYTKLTQDLMTEMQSRSEDNAEMERVKAGKQGEHTETAGARATKKSGLDAMLTTISGMEPSCNYFTVNFPVRVKNRQIETDGLLKAKAILTGAVFDPKKESQLQQLKTASVRRH